MPVDEHAEPAWAATSPDPACEVNGCIRELTEGLNLGVAILKGAAEDPTAVENGIQLYFIRYWSDGDEVTGTVLVPDSAPPEGGFPVAVMNSFTTGIGKPCAPSEGQLVIGVGSSTALRGVLTIVPDPTSYGPAPYGLYLEPRSAGRAALDGARAAFHLSQLSTPIPVARRAVITGLSQGGHSTMAAAAEFPTYAPKLEIKGFGASAPPANFRASTNAAFKAKTGFGAYTAMRLWTWQRSLGLSGEAVFKEPYRGSVEGWFGAECLRNGIDGSDGTLVSRFPSDPTLVVSDSFLAYAQDDSWPADWAKVYEASTPIPRGVTVPIAIFQGRDDELVPLAATDAYVKTMTDAGATIDYRVFDGGTHSTTAFSSFTVNQVAASPAIAWVHERLGAR